MEAPNGELSRKHNEKHTKEAATLSLSLLLSLSLSLSLLTTKSGALVKSDTRTYEYIPSHLGNSSIIRLLRGEKREREREREREEREREERENRRKQRSLVSSTQ